MVERVPSALPLAIGFVPGRRLVFHKQSVDGSGKADAAISPNPSDRVWGVVYRMALRDKPILDRCEFLGIGYGEVEVEVHLPEGTRQSAWMYTALPAAVCAEQVPYDWYRDYVAEGAVQHRLPFCHTLQILKTDTQSDPDRERATHHQNVLRWNRDSH